MLNSSPSTCALPELLAACLAASIHAGRVIREVVRTGTDLEVVNKADGAYDPQTIADRRAQQRMIFALRNAFPALQIVGEEGELAAPEAEDQVACNVDTTSLPSLTVPENLKMLEWEHLVLWMDPLDGTKRFAAKKYDEVSVLLGISYKQRAVAGVVHLPFQGNHGATYWGGPGMGVFLTTDGVHEKVSRPDTGFPRRPLTVTVSSTNCDLVNAALRKLSPGEVRTGGATGTMVLGVLTGESDMFLRFKNATRKWDICAVEPLLVALGGALVDAQEGQPYRYHPTEDLTFDNPKGLLACMDSQLLSSALQVMADVQHARTLDGDGMTPVWIERMLRTPLSAPAIVDVRVRSIVVENGTVRIGKHAHAAVLVAYRADGGAPIRMFTKRSIRTELAPRSTAHWARDLASYRNEARFYGHFHALLRTRVPLLGVYMVDQQRRPGFAIPGDANETIDDAFLMLMECAVNPMNEDADGFEPRDKLGTRDAREALAYLARLHAAASVRTANGGPRIVDQARGMLWTPGGWWTLEKRGEKELSQAADVWPQILAAFVDEFTAAGLDPANPQVAALGIRMMQNAQYVSEELNANGHVAETLIHGDFKAANLFFRRQTHAAVAFDWQWTGVGLGARDVAYFLSTSVSADALATDEAVDEDAKPQGDEGENEDADPFAAALDAGEAKLLAFYYSQLMAEAPHMTTAYSFAAFRRHYALGMLDYARLLVSNFWRGMTPASCRAKAACANCGLAYRSVPHVVRMVSRMDQWLAAVDAERVRCERK